MCGGLTVTEVGTEMYGWVDSDSDGYWNVRVGRLTVTETVTETGTGICRRVDNDSDRDRNVRVG